MSESQIPLFNHFSEEPDPVENSSDLEELLFSELNTNAVYQSTDWTVMTLLDQIGRGRIQLKPTFQRRDAWDLKRKSQFIESLILNFPIPQLVLAELQDKKGKYIVIDGKQRLLSLVQFAGADKTNKEFNILTLKGLDILKEINGKNFGDLSDENIKSFDVADFENRIIRTVVIKNWKNESILYHIFLRLNTGSVPLSPQELRNALHPGPFAEYIDERSSISPGLRKILGNDKPDFRMRDAEILLRYFAFRNFLNDYSGSMKQFLDKTTEQINKDWDHRKNEIEKQTEQFERAIELTYYVFGEDKAFRKWKDGTFVGRFNRAVFDVMLFNFWRPEIQELVREKREIVLDAFITLSRTHPEFVDAMESTTKSLGATSIRLSLWTRAFNKSLGLNLPVPKLLDNRIILE